MIGFDNSIDIKGSNINSLITKEDIVNAIIKATKYVDKKLTKKINSIAKGSNIQVYIDEEEVFFDKKIPNAFTMLGYDNPTDMANDIASQVIDIPVTNILKLIFCPIWILYVWSIYKNKKQIYY